MAKPAEPPEVPEPAEGEDISKRVDALEAGQDTITSKVDQILGILGKKPAEPATDPTATAEPASIADEIRQQLEARDAKAAADADKNATGQTLADLQAKVTELSEKQPAPVPRRVEKLMGWT